MRPVEVQKRPEGHWQPLDLEKDLENTPSDTKRDLQKRLQKSFTDMERDL